MSDLIEQYKLMHAQGRFNGLTLLRYKDEIKRLCEETHALTVLDYGSGKGMQYKAFDPTDEWGAAVTLYDPAVPGIDQLPSRPFDGVICTDVLEHLPEEDIATTITRLYELARLFLLVSICDRPSKKLLPDGRNCHVTVKPNKWWYDLMVALFETTLPRHKTPLIVELWNNDTMTHERFGDARYV